MEMKLVSKQKNSEETKEEKKIMERPPINEDSSKNVIIEKEEELVCPICGSKNVIKDYERAEIVCADCGCVLQQNLFDVGPEWRAFDHEQRVKRSRVGAPMTYSVDYNEPIIIKENGNVKIVKIGELIDRYIENSKNIRKEGILEIANIEDKNLEVVAFDSNYKFSYMNVSEVSRHPVNSVYNIVVEGNKHIKTTGSHSVFALKDGEVVETRVDELREGDYLVLAKRLPNVEHNIELDLTKLLKGCHIQFNYPYENNGWKKRQSAPVEYVINSKIEVPEFATVRYGSGLKIPSKLKIDETFAKILGYYIAEGHYTDNRVVFSFGKHETEYIDEVVAFFKKFGIKPKLYLKNSNKSAVQIEITNKVFVELFKSLGIKSGAKEKRVPSIIYLLPENLKIEFLKGYFNGDGNLYTNKKYSTIQLTAVSSSKELINDLMMLLLQLGINSNYNYELIKGHELNGQHIKDSDAYMLRITNPKHIVKLGYIENYSKENKKPPIEELIPAPAEYKKEWKCRDRKRISRALALNIAKKYNDKKLEKLGSSDFTFLKIKKIEKTKPTNGYAYDLTVPNAENFVAGYGAFVLHNTIHDKGLSTVIDWRNKDSYGKDISADKRAQLYRLRKWQRRIRVSDASERNLAFALSELDRIASKLGLPRNVRENAAVLYRGAVEKGLIRGRSIEGVAAAALYAACRRCKVPRTLDEIAEMSRVDRKEIGRTYRFISRELKIRLAPTSPIDYVPRFASELKLPGEVESKAISILQKAGDKGLTSGRGPTGVAAAAIYIASVLHGTRKTQREVADVAGVTEVTIRNRYKELTEHLDIDVTL